jgi:nitrogen-specific signal transduction histidine kinase
MHLNQTTAAESRASQDNPAGTELEPRFMQAQKMEVVGCLASGVAHDFNNMLGIILGYTEILMEGMTAGSVQYQNAQAVFRTGQRAAALTRQLLVFSRKQVPFPELVDLSELITTVDPMLRRLIGENIALVTLPELNLGYVESDAGQIEQVLMNLTVNARDAMPRGGCITIETGNAHVSPDDPAHPGVPAGTYAVLSVADTGIGMTAEVKAKIFEAFFTTKPVGHGTGLGLATCQKIVRQWHGHLTVESTPGAGARFKVYFPLVSSSSAAEKVSGTMGPPPRGTETILLVEDEAGLLALTATVLQRQGYTVLKAANGKEALQIVYEPRECEIDLVVTDMVMPEMGGGMMADWLEAVKPGIKILFTSGYTEWGDGTAIASEKEFIPKPYTPSALLRKVRQVLDLPGAESMATP